MAARLGILGTEGLPRYHGRKPVEFHKLFPPLIVLSSFVLGAYLYPQMPQRVASHWNEVGEVNGYMSRFWGIFLMPTISVVMYLVFLLIPKLDPKRENIEKFRRTFDEFITVIFVFLFYLYILTLIWNLGLRFDMIVYLVPAFSFLLYFCGVLMGQAEPNWSIGIRTPWTLSSEEVWRKTHTLGKVLFKATAAVSLLGLLFSKIAIWFLLIPLLASTLGLLIYSYVAYEKEQSSAGAK